MRILVLDLDSRAGDLLANAPAGSFGNREFRIHPALATALEELGDNPARPAMVLICGDDATKLLTACREFASQRQALPVIVLASDLSVEDAVELIKAGADDLVVRDAQGRWTTRLDEKLAGLKQVARIAQPKPSISGQEQDGSAYGNGSRLAQIVDGSSVAMFVLDQRHRVTHWNRACEALTGIAAATVIGTNEHWRAFYAEARPCMADLIINGAIEADIAHYYASKGYRPSPLLAGSYEAEDFFPAFGDGGRWLFFTAAPLYDARGTVIGATETLQDITTQKQAKDALRHNETLLRQIIQCSSVATFVIDREHRITHWNRACELLLGRTAVDAISTRELATDIYHETRPLLADLVLDDADETQIARYYADRYRRSPTIDGVFEVEDYFTTLPGEPRWLHFAAAPLHDEDGQTIGAIETLVDITERKLAEELMQESEQRLAQIVDGSAVASFVIDREHRLTHWNRACAALTGVPASEVLGTNRQWRAFYPSERPCLADLVVDNAPELLTRFYGNKKIHRSHIVEGGYEAQDFFPAFGSSGRWLYFTAAPLRNARGEVVGAVETLQDITEQKRAEEELRQSEERYRVLSITDGMTGLYNARHFAQRLCEEMERSQRYRHPLALMVMDVDNFKQFNDTWGHVEGDQVLIRLAECITACLRRTDQAFRYGGEEFVVLLPETDMEAAMAAAERVRTMFADSEISPATDSSVRCTASIGVTLFVPGESPRDFVARADSGTYEAKRQGKNRVIRIMPRVGDLPD